MLFAPVARFFFKTRLGAILLVSSVGLMASAGFTLFYVGTSTIKHGVNADADLTDRIEYLVDQDQYTVRGKQMLSGEAYRDTYRQPLYPMFHAAVTGICGDHPTLLYNRLGNSVLAAFGCVVIYLLGRRLFGHTVGLIAGLIAAVHINMVQKYGYIWAEVLAVPLLVLAMYFFVGFADTRRWRDLVLGAVFFGLATLTRPTTYYLAFVLPVWLWVVYGRINRPMVVRSIVVVVLILAILAPWAIHNTVIAGRFIPVSGPKWVLLCSSYAPEQLDEPIGANKGGCVPLWEPKYGYIEDDASEDGQLLTREEENRLYKTLWPEILKRVWKRIPS